ncbi:MAG TPA: UdgX family uracil-DNA binding protein, partial [Bryobacteraceae bacterium]|nr:UdgX family uracil-DNA binding protein [Bryobacteraceae bacterium]
TVFGNGPDRAEVVLAGEQPGNDEDLAGLPFVGPAGRMLDGALAAAGIDRSRTWVTNVVKHFKWEARGKRRIHSKPNAAEVKACMPWLEAEIRLLQPRMVICLGATSAQALLGRTFRVTQSRGQVIPVPWAGAAMATWHPSAILRAPDPDARQRGEAELVADLRSAAEWLENNQHAA